MGPLLTKAFCRTPTVGVGHFSLKNFLKNKIEKVFEIAPIFQKTAH